MTKLSPAALATWEAFNEEEAGVFVDYGDKLAAALRAMVDQVAPEHRENHPATLDERYRKLSVFELRNRILAIATELESQ
jgi:hypothetical protein